MRSSQIYFETTSGFLCNIPRAFAVVGNVQPCCSEYALSIANASANLKLALFSSGFIIRYYNIRHKNFLILCLWESTIKYRTDTLTI